MPVSARWTPFAALAQVVFVALASVAFVACGLEEGDASGGWTHETITSGDTTTVRTLSGAQWDAPREAVIEHEIGVLEGDENLMFGSVAWVRPDGSGGVYVFDSQVPALRRFDGSGAFLGPIGAAGEGPGEYSTNVTRGAVRSDGRLQIHDARQARVTIYGPDGASERSWQVPGGFFTAEMMFLDDRDHTFLRSIDFAAMQSGSPPRGLLLEYDPAGALVDTIPEPMLADEPEPSMTPLAPTKSWRVGPDGSIMVGSTASYRFEVRRRDGMVLRVEHHRTPEPVSDDEYAAYEAWRAWMIENQGQFMRQTPGPTPRVKPAWRSLHAGRDDTIWVRVYGPVHAREVPPPEDDRPPAFPFEETPMYDVFAADGGYLGEVRIPRRVSVSSFGLDELWGVRRGELDESYVVRMSLRPVG